MISILLLPKLLFHQTQKVFFRVSIKLYFLPKILSKNQ